ncbi:hypothetical protein E2C01_076532 [Portunus trituberculatus]|uniref:Uncharacterized protein n=1 Tax=Portunus trituberculatus TaxID=210409 RepID=A0A5B7INU6_PORTR|nr:hypothetical protein [Portunus trituberculatus]
MMGDESASQHDSVTRYGSPIIPGRVFPRGQRVILPGHLSLALLAPSCPFSSPSRPLSPFSHP